MRPGAPIRRVGCWALLPLLLLGCDGKGGGSGDAGGDTDSESATDDATDSDSETESETGSGSDSDSDACAEGLVRFVAHDADEGGDGVSWASAFDDVQAGLDTAGELAQICGASQVWVAQGTYYVYDIAVTDTIALRPGVELYGGFAGDEISLDERDPDPALTVFDGRDGPSGSNRVRHVMTGAGNALADGFTITGGRSLVAHDDDPYREGAGLLAVGVQGMLLRNCVVSGNEGFDSGGASVLDSGVGFVDCAFSENSTEQSGGAISASHAEIDVERCAFNGHTATTGLGGALGASESVLSIKRSTFAANVGLNGGGARFDNSWAWISGCVFSQNTADEGGALEAEGSQVQIVGSTFQGNSGFDASAILAEYSDVAIRSSIFWDNPLSTPGDVVQAVFSTVTVDYSVFAGGAAGEGNLNANPLFSDADGGDYHLQPGSPAIDAADGDVLAELDIELQPRADDPATVDTGVGDPSYCDMGAYEYQP